MLSMLLAVLMPCPFPTQTAPAKPLADVPEWHEAKRPPKDDLVESKVWHYAANDSPVEWEVFVEGEHVRARLANSRTPAAASRLPFVPAVEPIDTVRAVMPVDGGWIVGFNKGEFGASLYWFNPDGTANYKISDHQVVAFVQRGDDLLAIEGLAHLSLSNGSLIRIARAEPGGRWLAATLLELPTAPYAAVMRRDGTLVLALSDRVVFVDGRDRLRTLVTDEAIGDGYPDTAVLSPDESRLYIAGRQYVIEVNLTLGWLRFLVPDETWIHKLPADDEARIRRMWGGELATGGQAR